MSLKTLIVDDEPIARQILREESEGVSDVEIVGEVDNGAKALEGSPSSTPTWSCWTCRCRDGRTGRGAEPGARPELPVIVIVTAYDQYAIQAFEAGADGLPAQASGSGALAAAVARAKRLSGRDVDGTAGAAAGDRRAVAGARSPQEDRRHASGKSIFLLSADEILAFQAEGDIGLDRHREEKISWPRRP